MNDYAGPLEGTAVETADELAKPVTIGTEAYVSPEYALAERDGAR